MAARMGRGATDLGSRAAGQLAQLQAGCVATWQLRWLGWSDNAISRMAAREGWLDLHRGVWLLPGARLDAPARVWAAVLAVAAQDGAVRADARMRPDVDPLTVLTETAAERAVVAAGSAAWARQLWQGPPRRHVLLVDSGHHVARSDITIIRTGMDRFEGATRIGGLWVAGVPRIVWDCSWLTRRLPNAAQQIADLVIVADRLREMSADDLVAIVDEPCQFNLPMRVPAVLRAAAELVRPGFSHSKTEARGRRIAGEVAAGLDLEVHPRPYPIKLDGQTLAEADIAVLALRHDLEVDGPHHLTFAQRARDRRRDAGIATIDWAVTRYDVDLIDHEPDTYARLVGAHLRRRMDEAA